MWRFPGALLWLPTAFNAWIAAQILVLAWQRREGSEYNTAQGDIIGPYVYIIAISAPIAVVMLMAWAILAVLRINDPAPREAGAQRGTVALAIINILAPAALILALMLFA